MKKFLNPFVYYSGGATLTAGMIIMAAMVAVAGATGQTFRGIFSFGIGELAWWRLAVQLLAGWLIFSGVLYGAARLFSPSQIRLIDIAGNQALAKLPGLLMMLTILLYSPQRLLDEISVVLQNDTAALQHYTPSAGVLLTGVIGIVVLIWFFVWSYRGFAIAANLHGKKGAFVYIGSYLIAELLASGCTSLLHG